MKNSILKFTLFAVLAFTGIKSQAGASNADQNAVQAMRGDSIDPCVSFLSFFYNIATDSTGAVVFHPVFSYPFADHHQGFEIMKMTWDFGDGTTKTTKHSSNMGHLYEAPGTYEVCFTVWSTNGTDCCQETYCEKVVIEDTDPCRHLERFSIGVNYLDSTKFFALGWYAEDYNTGRVGYYWDFGDGTTANGLHAEHTYAAPGTYLVSLTLFYFSDDRGICCSHTVADSISFGVPAPLPGPGDDTEDNGGLAQPESNALLHIFPNPTEGEFIITSEENTIQSINVYDQMGHLVYTNKNIAETYRAKVDLSELAQGIYFVVINQEDEKLRSFNKIVIQ